MLVNSQPFLKVAYHIMFMINELDLLWMLHFIAFGIYFPFGTKFYWNEEIDICFSVECVLFCHNFDFLGSYCSLLVVTACYSSLLPVPTWLCIKPGLQERGTERRERGKWRNVIFWVMLLNIPGNVAKYSEERCQTFREM